jgi:multicomponent Na+:H+ antiporter subunit D
MIADLPPGLILVLGALLAPLLRPTLRSAYLVLLPALALAQLLSLENGIHGQFQMFGHVLTLLRIDALARVFALIFVIAALVCAVYGWRERDAVQQVSSQIYAGAAVCAVLAGDLVSLFIFWELTAIASVFLIWAARNERAYRAGMRYLIIQIASGVILLAGIILHYRATGSIAFGALSAATLPGGLILLAVGIKAAFPLLHAWLPDAYPKATLFGSVVLSAFTTKLAVYALARGYAGTEILIWIGAAMAIYGSIFALIEDNLRKLLAYSLNAQLGFLVVAVGVGSPLALGGAAGHAVSSILYMLLLFMCAGAAISATGRETLSSLGGLGRQMPWTAALCVIGAASIAALPGTSAFVTKSLILSSLTKAGLQIPWLLLLAAAALTVVHTAIRVPYHVFFARAEASARREAPLEMRFAMTATAALLLVVGFLPGAFYALLPGNISYSPYSLGHIVTQLQLVIFAALGFAMLRRHKLDPQLRNATNIDADWLYRRLLPSIMSAFGSMISHIHFRTLARAQVRLNRFIAAVYRHHGPQGALARTWPVGSTVLWVAVLLCVTLVFYYVE